MVFKDRHHAGLLLADKLQKYRALKNTLVMGIPRGGVIVAKSISDKLELPLLYLVAKKISAPFQKELAIGAIAPEGTVVLDIKAIEKMKIAKEYLEYEFRKKTDEIVKRMVEYGRINSERIRDKNIILVDDGIATGSTVEAAIAYLRNKRVSNIVLAVPVAPANAFSKFNKLADEIVILSSPDSFEAVGQFYENFPQVSDSEVKDILGD